MASIDAVLARIDTNQPGAQERALRNPGHPLDLHRPCLRASMRARCRLAGRRTERSRFHGVGPPDRRTAHGGGPYQGGAPRCPACAVLRSLRRAAGRSPVAVEQRPLQARAAGGSQRVAHRRARRFRRQGSADDLRRGLQSLQGDRWTPLRRHGPVRGRRRDGFAFAPGFHRGRGRCVESRPRARLRYGHVGCRDALHHDDAARPRARRDRDQRGRPRSSFRSLWRRRGQSDPCRVADHRRAPRCQGACGSAGILRRRRRTPGGCGRAMARVAVRCR